MPAQSPSPASRTALLITTALSTGVLAGALALSGQPAQAAPQEPGGATSSETAKEDTTVDDLNDEQIDNARTIIAVGKGEDIPEDGITIALMTALQESSLLNPEHGDRDSQGLFQQRPSMGWGTEDEITDPVFASRSFYGSNPAVGNPGLLQIDDWESMEPGDAAQSVQASAYPKAYAPWEDLARDLLGDNDDVEAIG